MRTNSVEKRANEGTTRFATSVGSVSRKMANAMVIKIVFNRSRGAIRPALRSSSSDRRSIVRRGNFHPRIDTSLPGSSLLWPFYLFGLIGLSPGSRGVAAADMAPPFRSIRLGNDENVTTSVVATNGSSIPKGPVYASGS